MSNKLLWMAVVIMLASCHRDSLPVNEYLAHIESEEHGLKRIIVIDGWEYTIQYKPHEYILSQESRGGMNDSVYRSRVQQLKGTAWFNISFKKQNSNISPLKYEVSSMPEYEARYNYYLTQAMNDIALVYGGDTLRPMSYLFETSYNLAPMETILTGFSLPGNDSYPSKDMQLVFFDRVFRNGIIKASFREALLKQIPDIKK